MPSVISGDANVSATEFGYLDGVTSALQTQMDAKAPLASPTFTGTPELPAGTTLAGAALNSGKILQIVRATDNVQRTTTSTSFVDGSISVTISPQKSDSAIILIWSADTSHTSTSNYAIFQITDASNVAVSGAEGAYVGSNSTTLIEVVTTIIGYATPATTSATTYKVRFCASASGTAQINNNGPRGQMYAIEVAA